MSYMNQWVNKVTEYSDIDASIEENTMLAVLYALLAKTKESSVTEEDVHDAWSLWTEYVLGNYEHKSLVPFNELREEVQNLDQPYVEAIHKTFLKVNRGVDA